MSKNNVSNEVLEIIENIPASLNPNCWADARLSDMLCLDDEQNVILATTEDDVNNLVADVERAQHDSGQETILVSTEDTTMEPPPPSRINSGVSSMFLESGNIREMKIRLKSLRPVCNFQWHAGESLSSISTVNATDGKVYDLRVTSMDTSGVVKVISNWFIDTTVRYAWYNDNLPSSYLERNVKMTYPACCYIAFCLLL